MSSDSDYSYYSDLSEEEEFRLYREIPEWSDITPIEISDAPEGEPFHILYNQTYKDLFGYFSALLQKDEISKRALSITERVIKNYTSTYTAWWYKYRILEQLGYDFKKEDKFLNGIIRFNPKSYQAWYYKQWLLDHEKILRDQIPSLRIIFEQDPKNFHAWSFALWYAKRWHQEKEVFLLAKKMCQSDCRNNSAWNARKTLGDMLNISPRSEFEESIESLKAVSKNEATFNFAIAMIHKDPSLIHEFEEVGKLLLKKNPLNMFAWLIKLFILEFKKKNGNENENEKNQNEKEKEEICDKLMELDPIRIPYYTLIKEGKICYQ
ncbi:Protein farnesyltransferase/geranylgeranyltransferase type-1 subunit alpha [Tritrichomonas foetus]|uniref:Protein farnesyltransferase/geranylgeranyltransferase type-1 subunit alpha n=1 Tax=Tritrichomonas foetus TaxID=1144522 RepID=A0A1J4KGK7_9EUKA|nr:Protein farnesyltransferase/geranylgeranyltransferase type-1 subunit alpha [Tritrichomonas foetus]|eukprot:OHT08932.1 Protein farnesyltransferase/geranylgeranyltransferase type-1 subunit alpha [Tritrichomonas foetus]